MAGERKGFGFGAAMSEGPSKLDLSGFDGSPKPVDRDAAKVVTEVASERGFTARAPKAVTAPPAAPKSKAKARLRISEVGGRKRTRDKEDRVQVNIYAPVSVALRWIEFEEQHGGAAWKAFEALLDKAGVPRPSDEQ